MARADTSALPTKGRRIIPSAHCLSSFSYEVLNAHHDTPQAGVLRTQCVFELKLLELSHHQSALLNLTGEMSRVPLLLEFKTSGLPRNSSPPPSVSADRRWEEATFIPFSRAPMKVQAQEPNFLQRPEKCCRHLSPVPGNCRMCVSFRPSLRSLNQSLHKTHDLPSPRSHLQEVLRAKERKGQGREGGKKEGS